MLLAAGVTSTGGVPAWAYIAGGIGAAAITAIVSFLIARRTSSGRISTTEAATLWQESQTMRHELRDEVAKWQAKAETLEAKIDTLEQENTQLRLDALQCKQEAHRLSDELAEVQRQLAQMRRPARKRV